MSFTELIPIDQEELLKIEELQTKKEAEKLAKDTVELQMIMSDLNELLINQNEALHISDETIQKTNDILTDTNQELEKAKQNQQKMGLLKMSCLFALGGLIIGGPLGIVGGYYAGITATGGLLGSITGAGISGSTAYSVFKKKQNNQKRKEKQIKIKEQEVKKNQ